MWIVAVIFFFTTIFCMIVAIQNGRACADQKQRNNFEALCLAMYQYLLQFGRLPKTSHDLRQLLPSKEAMSYYDPYHLTWRPYLDDSTEPMHPSGVIRFSYHPPSEKHPETVVVCAFGRDGQSLQETWIPMKITS